MKILNEWKKIKKQEVQGFTGVEVLIGSILAVVVGALLFINLMPSVFTNFTNFGCTINQTTGECISRSGGTATLVISAIFGIVLVVGFLKLLTKNLGGK